MKFRPARARLPRRWAGLALSLLALAASAPQSVSAQVPEAPHPEWTLSVEALTDFPIHVGGAIHITAPHGLRFHTSVGVLPRRYLDTIHAVSKAADWYDETTATLISAALKNSLVWQLQVGWRPWTQHGFYFAGGYSLAALGGGLSGAEVVAAATGEELPASSMTTRNFAIDAITQMVDIEIGWEWYWPPGFTLRAALGGIFTIASSTEIEATWSPTRRAEGAIDRLSLAGERYLDDTLTSYVHSVVVSLAGGWRF